MTVSQFRERWRDHVPRPAGVLREYAVLAPLAERDGTLQLLFEVRAATLNRQPGEVCFPGGRLEGAETPAACALRETWEELRIPPESVELLGLLDYQFGQGEFLLHPVLGLVESGAAEALRPNPAEVQETFWVPVDYLRAHPPSVYTYDLVPDVGEDFPYARIGFAEGYRWRRGRIDVPVYQWGDRAIWGLTGRIVRELMEGMA